MNFSPSFSRLDAARLRNLFLDPGFPCEQRESPCIVEPAQPVARRPCEMVENLLVRYFVPVVRDLVKTTPFRVHSVSLSRAEVVARPGCLPRLSAFQYPSLT